MAHRPVGLISEKTLIRFIRLFLLLIFAVLGAAFASLNGAMVSVDYYFGLTELPLSIVILIALGIGVILGGLAGLALFFRAKRENYQLRRKSQLVNEEVNNLRVMPLKDH